MSTDDLSAWRALDSGSVMVDVGGLEVIRAAGADRVTFLHRLLTADIAGCPVGGGRHALLLDLKGHVVGDFKALVAHDEVRLVTAPGQGQRLALALSKYAVMDDFAATPIPGLAALGVFGPGASASLTAAGMTASALDAAPAFTHVEAGDMQLVRVAGFGQRGFWLLAARDRVDAFAAALASRGVPRLPPDHAEAARIRAGEPRFGAEVTDDRFPMEIGLSHAIDYSKGCYLGQEPIVRIRDRGHVNWRLAGLRFAVPEGGMLPRAGDQLHAETRAEAGHLTSVAPGVGLALVHRNIPAGGAVTIETASGSVDAKLVELDPPANRT